MINNEAEFYRERLQNVAFRSTKYIDEIKEQKQEHELAADATYGDGIPYKDPHGQGGAGDNENKDSLMFRKTDVATFCVNPPDNIDPLIEHLIDLSNKNLRKLPYPLFNPSYQVKNNVKRLLQQQIENNKNNNNNNRNKKKWGGNWNDYYITPFVYATTNKAPEKGLCELLQNWNKNCGELHMESFSLCSTLINYPPIFCMEDINQVFLNGLQYEGEKIAIKKRQHKKERAQQQQQQHQRQQEAFFGERALSEDLLWQIFRTMSEDTGFRSIYCIRRDSGTDSKLRWIGGREISAMQVFCDCFVLKQFFPLILGKHDIEGENEEKTVSGRQEWTKAVSVRPIGLKLSIASETSCRMFRHEKHINRSGVTFLRIQFQTLNGRQDRKSDDWKYGKALRAQAIELLSNGIIVGGAIYYLFFYSDGQLRDKKAWFYSIELSRHYNSIEALSTLIEFVWLRASCEFFLFLYVFCVFYV